MKSKKEERELLLIGGGHTHSLVLRELGRRPIDGVSVTLVSDSTEAAYSGAVPALIEGRISREDAFINLLKLTEWAGAQFIQDTVVNINAAEKIVLLKNRGELQSEILSINTGIHTPLIEGVDNDTSCIAVKPIAPFLLWLRMLEEELKVESQTIRIAIVGGGAAGVEISLALKKRFSRIVGGENLHLTIIDRSEVILPAYPGKAREVVSAVLKEQAIRVIKGVSVKRRVGKRLEFKNGKSAEVDRVIFATGAKPERWVADCGLRLSSRGFIETDDTLQSTSHAGVFAVGDIADISGEVRPKAGVFAVRQATPLLHNLRSFVKDDPLKRFQFQTKFLKLIGLANGRVLFIRGKTVLFGRWVLRLKNFIDLRFIRGFSNLTRR